MRRRVALAGAAVVVVVAAGVAAIFREPLRIAYHRNALRAAWESLETLGPRHAEAPLYRKRADEHRDALARLGYLEVRQVTLEHIVVESPELRDLTVALQQMDGPFFESPYRNPVTVTLWGTAGEIERWETLIRDADRAAGKGATD